MHTIICILTSHQWPSRYKYVRDGRDYASRSLPATQMSSSGPSTIAHKIPNEIWERVAYHENATEQSFLGPPKDIVNICLVCQSFNRAIGFDANPSLYARIFRFKFDYRAPLRRFGTEWLNARSMAHELKKRFEALKQIRQRECSTQDLWTCFLM